MPHRLSGIALLLVLAAGCGEDTTDPSTLAVTGTVTYLERIAMPQGAVVTVRLEDVSRADVAAVLLGQQVITAPGQVPVAYRVEYDSGSIDARNTYTVRAEIRVNGQLWATSTQAYLVITRGHPSTGVEILVSRVP